MSFANLSLSMVLLGLVVVAAALFVLQILRARHRTIVLPTTVFWQQAVQESPVRVFTKKFRHILAYLLSLLIAALLWLGFSEPINTSADNKYYVLYLDGSAAMTQDNVYKEALRTLEADLTKLPVSAREVVWGGQFHDTLLDAGEQNIIFERRSQALKPQNVPSSLKEFLTTSAHRFAEEQDIEVRVYGRASIDQKTLDNLPGHIGVYQSYKPEALVDNSGIVSLGYAYPISGSPEHVDVLVTLASTSQSVPEFSSLRFRINEQEFVTNRVQAGEQGQFLLQDIPANGAIFSAELQGTDSLAVDNNARLRLPNTAITNVILSDMVPQAIRTVIELDPILAVTSVEDEADVAIHLAEESFASHIPALVLDANQANAFEVSYTDNMSSELALQQSLSALGIEQIDATSLAQNANFQIGIDVTQAQQKQIGVWPLLFQQEYNFTASPAFPLFVAKSVRWLAGVSPRFSFVAAGQYPHMEQADFNKVQNPSLLNDSLNVMPFAGVTGKLSVAAEDLEVSLLNKDVTMGEQGAKLTESQAIDISSAFSDWLFWLVAALSVLLLAELFAFTRGMIP